MYILYVFLRKQNDIFPMAFANLLSAIYPSLLPLPPHHPSPLVHSKRPSPHFSILLGFLLLLALAFLLSWFLNSLLSKDSKLRSINKRGYTVLLVWDKTKRAKYFGTEASYCQQSCIFNSKPDPRLYPLLSPETVFLPTWTHQEACILNEVVGQKV